MLFISYTAVNAQGERIAPPRPSPGQTLRKTMQKRQLSQVFSNKKIFALLFPSSPWSAAVLEALN